MTGLVAAPAAPVAAAPAAVGAWGLTGQAGEGQVARIQRWHQAVVAWVWVASSARLALTLPHRPPPPPADTAKFGRFHRGMLEQGIYLAPSQFEAGFTSLSHTEADIDATIEAARTVLKSL